MPNLRLTRLFTHIHTYYSPNSKNELPCMLVRLAYFQADMYL